MSSQLYTNGRLSQIADRWCLQTLHSYSSFIGSLRYNKESRIALYTYHLHAASRAFVEDRVLSYRKKTTGWPIALIHL